MDKKSEIFFTELAKAYAENEGVALQNEFAQLAAENRLPHASGLDRKKKNKLNHYKAGRYGLRLMPLAASIIFVMLIYNGYRSVLQQPFPTDESVASNPAASVSEPSNAVSSQPAEASDITDRLQSSVAFVSASLPAGYELTAVDYDNLAAIMQITNDRNNRIVLMTEEYRDFDKDAYTKITIHGSTAYGLMRDGYSLLRYGKDDMLYTFTSLYGYQDLIEISKNML